MEVSDSKSGCCHVRVILEHSIVRRPNHAPYAYLSMAQCPTTPYKLSAARKYLFINVIRHDLIRQIGTNRILTNLPSCLLILSVLCNAKMWSLF
ncbi:hypothetical protein GDO81_020078 [Engystomops pustulosus]|uniref:Uncharacterized protein n=1 Tax=Engystomops pustulosus TaxID=76066 RepID=A0AAV6ZJ91_ENGPU|nr:hypothetical protein GDO81_020078 [Engystomops pustulosus]